MARAVAVSVDQGLAVLSVSRPEVMAAIVTSYGDVVLLRPHADGVNLVLRLAAPAVPLAGRGVGAGGAAPPESLSPEAAARLADLPRR